MANTEGLWNSIQVAERLSVSRHTIRAWVRRKEMPYVKLGKAVRFEAEAIRQWVDTHRVPIAPPTEP